MKVMALLVALLFAMGCLNDPIEQDLVGSCDCFQVGSVVIVLEAKYENGSHADFSWRVFSSESNKCQDDSSEWDYQGYTKHLSLDRGVRLSFMQLPICNEYNISTNLGNVVFQPDIQEFTYLSVLVENNYTHTEEDSRNFLESGSDE